MNRFESAVSRLREITLQRRNLDDQRRALDDEEVRLLDSLDATGAPQRPAADRWITTKTAMRLLGADSPSTIYRARDQFGLDARRDGGRWLFSELDVLDLARRRQRGDARRIRGEKTSLAAISSPCSGEEPERV